MAKDMTKGAITPQLIKFTIPLILGNLFQLTYNAADSVIVGKYVGDDALAAVGTAGPIMNMAILFISGMCMGSGILMSMMYGAGDNDKLERQTSTTLIGGLLFSVIVTIAMIFCSVPILRLINVPEDIIPGADRYLRIIFFGFIFTFVYNFYANTLRALGDSTTPLYFLVISAVLNIIGDLFFVVVLKMGVEGSAISTVICSALSCLFCGIYIKLRVPMLCLGKKWRVFDPSLLWRTFTYGITGALQQMCVQLGKVFVQALVNTQGVDFMAAFTAINRVDDFALTPQQNIAHATTTFLAQNKGAGNNERIRKGFFAGFAIEMAYSLLISVTVYFSAGFLMKMFVKEESQTVINMGVAYLQTIAVIYFMPGITNCVQGFFRGMGDLKVTLMSTIANMSARVIAAHIIIGMGGGFGGLAVSNFWGWVAMLSFEVPLFIRSMGILIKGRK